jgi:serine/threonine-protein kinase
MNWLSDEAIARLQTASALPDLSGTRYSLIGRVGSGGMGTVYLATDSILGRRVALKVLDLADAQGELGARLLREAHILARLEHPGIVPVHDAGTLADGRVFYAMKFVEGERLDVLAKRVEALSDSLRIFQRVCEAVAFAHARGILHRDLKPENIMVDDQDNIKLIDFGIASDSAARRLTYANFTATLGTPNYISPEQVKGKRGDGRSDIYSMGVILY